MTIISSCAGKIQVRPARRARREFLRWKALARESRIARAQLRAQTAILRTPPAKLDRHARHEVRSLACQRDHIDLLWALKTLIHYSKRTFDVVVHDDGSLTSEAIDILQRHLSGVRIVSSSAAADRVADLMPGNPACRAFREACSLIRRLFDSPAFATRADFLIFDSDVLFFCKPVEMLACMDGRQPFFMSDFQDAYVLSRYEVKKKYGLTLLPDFNAGISYPSKNMLVYGLMGEYCSGPLERGLLSRPWSEQMLFAMLFSRNEREVRRLSAGYSISQAPIGKNTVSHHFVNDGSRGDLYARGIPHLRRAKFLLDYSRAVTAR